MNENDRALLIDMLEFARRVERRTVGHSRADLELDDEALGGLILRELAVVGEAAHHLTNAFRDAHPEIPAFILIGMRNRLVHGYRSVNWDIVWESAVSGIPSLIRSIEAILADDA
jgi:uncharacterized protein with HEPN domain